MKINKKVNYNSLSVEARLKWLYDRICCIQKDISNIKKDIQNITNSEITQNQLQNLRTYIDQQLSLKINISNVSVDPNPNTIPVRDSNGNINAKNFTIS